MSAALAAAQNKADLHRVTTEERLFHSEYNVPPGHAAAPNEVRWALRGYLPPKHLRIDGYNYGIPEETEAVFVEYAPDIVKRESTSALMAGCFVHDSDPVEEGMEEGISVGTITMSTSTPRLLGPGGLRVDFLFASGALSKRTLCDWTFTVHGTRFANAQSGFRGIFRRVVNCFVSLLPSVSSDAASEAPRSQK
jgi:hypothetical protein